MTSVTVTTTVGWIDGATQSLRSKKLGDIARKKDVFDSNWKPKKQH